MKYSIKEIKRIARGNLNNRYGIPMRALVMATMIPMLLESVFSYFLADISSDLLYYAIYYCSEILIMILSGVLKTGEALIHLEMARNERFSVRDVFYCFRNSSNHYFVGIILRTLLDVIGFAPIFVLSFLLPASDNIFSAGFLSAISGQLPLYLGLLLFGILLTVYISLSFHLFLYVLLDQEEASVLTVLRDSFRMMRGNRIRMIRLYLSYLGMYALAMISLGIGLLWVSPYMKQAIAVFYRDANGEFRQ